MKKLVAAAAALVVLTGTGGLASGASATSKVTACPKTALSCAAATTIGTKAVAAAAAAAPSAPSGVEPASMWDTPIPSSWAVDPASATEVANFVASIPVYYNDVGLNQMPVFTVPAGQPEVPITANPGAGTSFLTQIGNGAPIPVGAYTTSSTYSSDSAMIISQPSTNSVWELWQARKSATGAWSASWGGLLAPSTTSGVFPFPYGMSASGISYFGTMITEADVASGVIDHAVDLSIPLCNSWIYPANRGDCKPLQGYFSEGTLVKLPATVVMPPNLTPLAQMTFKALQTYGAVVIDYAGSNVIEGENRHDWAFSGQTGVDPITTASNGKPSYAVFNGIPWASLVVVDPAQ